MARQQLRRYIWLIDTIRGTDGITFDQINQRWLNSSLNEDGKNLSKRTFHDHIDAILDEFDIEIVCDRNNGYRYRIEEFDEYGSVRRSLVDALVLENAVRETPEINNHIIFYDQSHRGNLSTVVQAIKDRTIIKFRYQHDYSYSRANAPECSDLPDTDYVDEIAVFGLFFCGVWFLVGEVSSDQRMHIYALHRLSEIVATDKTYSFPEDFDVRLYMSTYSAEIPMDERSFLEDDGLSLTVYLTDAQQSYLL